MACSANICASDQCTKGRITAPVMGSFTAGAAPGSPASKALQCPGGDGICRLARRDHGATKGYETARAKLAASYGKIAFDDCAMDRRHRRLDCVEPRPLAQTGPQGDSLLACGTRRRRRPSRLERARRREAHWTVVASPPRKRHFFSSTSPNPKRPRF